MKTKVLRLSVMASIAVWNFFYSSLTLAQCSRVYLRGVSTIQCHSTPSGLIPGSPMSFNGNWSVQDQVQLNLSKDDRRSDGRKDLLLRLLNPPTPNVAEYIPSANSLPMGYSPGADIRYFELGRNAGRQLRQSGYSKEKFQQDYEEARRKYHDAVPFDDPLGMMAWQMQPKVVNGVHKKGMREAKARFTNEFKNRCKQKGIPFQNGFEKRPDSALLVAFEVQGKNVMKAINMLALATEESAMEAMAELKKQYPSSYHLSTRDVVPNFAKNLVPRIGTENFYEQNDLTGDSYHFWAHMGLGLGPSNSGRVAREVLATGAYEHLFGLFAGQNADNVFVDNSGIDFLNGLLFEFDLYNSLP